MVAIYLYKRQAECAESVGAKLMAAQVEVQGERQELVDRHKGAVESNGSNYGWSQYTCIRDRLSVLNLSVPSLWPLRWKCKAKGKNSSIDIRAQWRATVQLPDGRNIPV